MRFILLLSLIGLALAKPHLHGNGRGNGNGNGNGNTNTQTGIALSSGTSTFAATCSLTRNTLSASSTFIVGGSRASDAQFPWQVALVANGDFICGGSFVMANDGSVKVITAAHCVESRNARYEVIFGMQSLDEASNGYWATVSNVVRHRRYSSSTMRNDIAVLEFGSIDVDALQRTHAAPICLASQTYNDGEMSTVSGWGTTSEGGSISTNLMYVNKPLLAYDYCNTQTNNAGHLDSSMMCAGDTGIDACQGDSGGPLVAERNGIWELIGVVSWGFGCGRANTPGVYADVYNLRTWLGNNGIQ